VAIFLATRNPPKKEKKKNIFFISLGEKGQKTSQLMKIHPSKKLMNLGLYDNWLHFGNPKTLNPTVHVHQKDRTSI